MFAVVGVVSLLLLLIHFAGGGFVAAVSFLQLLLVVALQLFQFCSCWHCPCFIFALGVGAVGCCCFYHYQQLLLVK